MVVIRHDFQDTQLSQQLYLYEECEHTTADQTSHTDVIKCCQPQSQQSDTLIQTLVENDLVPHFCQQGYLFNCSNFNSYVARKECKCMDSSHKMKNTRMWCFVTFAARLVSTGG
jgi:hypothetical protein